MRKNNCILGVSFETNPFEPDEALIRVAVVSIVVVL